MYTFSRFNEINARIESGNPKGARDLLARPIDDAPEDLSSYRSLMNELLIACGLNAYTSEEGGTWWQRFNRQAFTFSTGAGEKRTLHQPKPEVLSKLLAEKSVALSAPTSFGKSLIIDSFISLKNPKSVPIVVPTISFMDEFRRRLTQKFSDTYDIITQVRDPIRDHYIYVLPQERAVRLIDRIKEIDFFVVDEFYKISPEFDKERSPALARAVLNFKSIAKQSYFLTPNINSISIEELTKGVEFLYKLDFNTVFLDIHDLSKELSKNDRKKSRWLVQMIGEADGKTIIYAGTFPAINLVSDELISELPVSRTLLLADFSDWLEESYTPNWALPSLIRRGIGVHSGKMHRSLSSLQVQLFE